MGISINFDSVAYIQGANGVTSVERRATMTINIYDSAGMGEKRLFLDTDIYREEWVMEHMRPNHRLPTPHSPSPSTSQRVIIDRYNKDERMQWVPTQERGLYTTHGEGGIWPFLFSFTCMTQTCDTEIKIRHVCHLTCSRVASEWVVFVCLPAGENTIVVTTPKVLEFQLTLWWFCSSNSCVLSCPEL